MKKIFIFVLIVILVVLGYSVLLNNKPLPVEEEAFCAQDVLLCPDGSYVARSLPKCEFAACPKIEEVEATDKVKVGQTVIINGVSITLNKIVADNRCPIDVTCIVAGAVTANITLAKGANKETRELRTDEKPILFGSHLISISSVSPATVSTETIDKKDYILTFKVTTN